MEEQQECQAGEQVKNGTHRKGQLVAAAHLQKATRKWTDPTEPDASDDGLRGCQPRPLTGLDVLHTKHLTQR